MKNNHLIVMALIVLTSACVPSIQPPTPRPFVAGISSTMTKSVFEATERAKITPTVIAGNSNPNMTATPDIYTNFRSYRIISKHFDFVDVTKESSNNYITFYNTIVKVREIINILIDA